MLVAEPMILQGPPTQKSRTLRGCRPATGIRYDVSILQAEFALTQVFDRPAQGRVFFEEVVRENLGMGRPDHVQLIFDRRVSRRTPSRYRTRVVTDGVIPSLHVNAPRRSASATGGCRAFAALLRFDLLPQGFRNRELRETVAALCGLSPDDYGACRMTYDLRHLRLRGIIERIPRNQRYRLTAEGRRQSPRPRNHVSSGASLSQLVLFVQLSPPVAR